MPGWSYFRACLGKQTGQKAKHSSRLVYRSSTFGSFGSPLSGATMVIVGTIIQITAMPGHLAGHQFVIGRIVTGFGNGLNTATVPSWQAECSRANNRGLHICIEAGMIATGTVCAYWLGTFSSSELPEKDDSFLSQTLVFPSLTPRYHGVYPSDSNPSSPSLSLSEYGTCPSLLDTFCQSASIPRVKQW